MLIISDVFVKWELPISSSLRGYDSFMFLLSEKRDDNKARSLSCKNSNPIAWEFNVYTDANVVDNFWNWMSLWIGILNISSISLWLFCDFNVYITNLYIFSFSSRDTFMYIVWSFERVVVALSEFHLLIDESKLYISLTMKPLLSICSLYILE